jgi:hypothetical protein
MVETLNFKKGATVIKLNTAVTNLNVRGILMSHCRRGKNTENIPLNWLKGMGSFNFTVFCYIRMGCSNYGSPPQSFITLEFRYSPQNFVFKFSLLQFLH